MLENNDSTKQIQELSGASSSAINRWRAQYRRELLGETPQTGKALTPEQKEIQSLQKQLREAKQDNDILKKAAALFIREQNGLR